MLTYRRLALAALLAGAPLAAQRGGQPPDTIQVRQTAAGFLFNFENQPLNVIISALADAGGLNVSASNIPTRNASLKLGTPVMREDIAEVLITFADQNGLRIAGDSTGRRLMRVEGTAPQQQPSQQQLLQQQLAATQLKVHVHRLKHASAVQLAPVLQALFTGTGATGLGGIGGRGGLGGVQVFPGAAGGGGGRGQQGGQQGGRGGRGGIDNAAAGNAAALGAILGGAAGRGGRGGQGGNQAAQALIGQILGGGANPAFAALGIAQEQGGPPVLSASSAFISVVPEEASNSLLIRATDQDYQLIQQVLQGIDLRPLQVLIEVTIAEVTRTEDLDVGLSGSGKRIPEGKTAADVTAVQPSSGNARAFVLQLSDNQGTIQYDLALTALQSRGNVRVLSLPVIIAQNNRQAVLNVGEQRPFVQVSQTVPNDPTGRVETIQYLPVGTVLTITPTINPDGYVNLQVTQTANSATNQIQFNAPVISERSATTQVFVRDGQTTVVGGLADNSMVRTDSGIPFLSRLPFIGWLFGSKQRQRITSELFLFLTPHVIFNDTDVDRMREGVKAGSQLLHEVDVGARINPGDTIRVPRDSFRPLPPRPDTTLVPAAADLLRAIIDSIGGGRSNLRFPVRADSLGGRGRGRGGAPPDTTTGRGRGAPPDTTVARSRSR